MTHLLTAGKYVNMHHHIQMDLRFFRGRKQAKNPGGCYLEAANVMLIISDHYVF